MAVLLDWYGSEELLARDHIMNSQFYHCAERTMT